jgi:S1-C subfamily serine protease
MKRIFPILVFAVVLNMAFSQSGGTSFDRHLDRLAARAERLAECVEAKVERTADIWEARSEAVGEQAERFGEQMEDRWNQDWSVKLGRVGRSHGMDVCPEVAFLGIESHEVSLEKAKKLGFENCYGSYVSKVMAESSAEKAGLKAFDYIYGVNDQRTSNNQNLSDILEDYKPGDEITLHLIRKGEKMTTTVKLASYDHEGQENEEAHPFLGVSPADEDEGELDGVAVDIVEKSTAQEMGLQVGDVITSINGNTVLDWDDVTTAIQNTRPGETIEVSFLREDKPLTTKGTIKSYEEVYSDDASGNWNLNVDWDEIGNVTLQLPDDWDQDQEPVQDENRAFIGIYTEMISMEKAQRLGFDNPYGAYITGIIPNSGADKAGLKPFDYIYGFDEYRAGAEQHLGIVLSKFKPGQTATVHYIRKGKTAKASITFTKPFSQEKKEMNSCEDPFFGINQMDENESGVVVSPVKGSTAAELNMQEGDVITFINGYKMVDWQDISTAIDMMKPGETINVDFLRDGRAMKASRPIKSYAQTKNCADCDCGGKATVVIATAPSLSNGRGWVNTTTPETPTPRVNVQSVKPAFGEISASESGSLRSKGIQLPDASTLNVENLRLSPNAEAGMFDLEFNLPTKGSTLVRIYNLTGRVLYEYDLGSFSGKFSDSVDISQNGIGNYFLEISQNGKVFSKKITLSRD